VTTHQIAIGWDQIDALQNVADKPVKLFEPRSPLTAPARRLTLLNRARQADGYTLTRWVYADYLTTTRLRQLLEQMGLRAGAVEIDSRDVTVRTPGEDRDWEYWNGTIYHPRSEYTFARFGETVFELALVEYLPRAFSSAFTGEFE
jgi:hypothetical protein